MLFAQQGYDMGRGYSKYFVLFKKFNKKSCNISKQINLYTETKYIIKMQITSNKKHNI